jgi:hypothetical protein
LVGLGDSGISDWRVSELRQRPSPHIIIEYFDNNPSSFLNIAPARLQMAKASFLIELATRAASLSEQYDFGNSGPGIEAFQTMRSSPATRNRRSAKPGWVSEGEIFINQSTTIL